VDNTKPNYVPAAQMVDHPESLNINYKQTKDWMHMNGVDYNPILDQVAFSSHNLNEWYIVDHSTTTAEAAGHTGGNSGKGGDILFRWGNPAAYGATGTAILNVTHDAHWIPEGVPNAGRLVGFNNKGVSASQSAIDQITTPVSGYTYTKTAGQPFAPATYDARHACNGYSSNMGNSQQLPNGNMLVCIATAGKIYEINSAGTQLWTKTISGGSLPQAFVYDSCYIFNTPPAIPTITATGTTLSSTAATTYQWYLNGVLISGANSQTYTPTATGVYVVRITDANGCVYQYSPGVKFTYTPASVQDEQFSDKVQIYPNPGNGIFTIQADGNQEPYNVSVYDMLGNMVKNFHHQSILNLSDLSEGNYMLHLTNNQGTAIKKVTLRK
ncbi:MAG TPA: T9SS type A sorting domain-containing protein, partial [Chitinophagaceae bacterium]|nr:T9SS type A sorting domain-containing protein [Chitinophagaceae bacterium]